MAPIFDYKAFSPDGKPQRGIVESESAKAARQKLKKQGLMVSEIIEKTTSRPDATQSIPFFGGRVSVREVAMLTRQFASLVKANIPIVEALNALVEQSEKASLKVILSQVRQDVNEGISLAKAMGKHPKAFDNIFINMIEAGESSGTLSLVLLRLADLKEAQMRLRSKVIGGMTYPALMMGVALVLLIAIFTFVIPKLTKVFDSMHKPIPGTTKALIFFSNTVTSYWYLIIGAVLFSLWTFKSYTRTTKGRASWDRFQLKLPVFGPLIRMMSITRFASTLSTLLGSGVPILSAISISKNLVNSVPIAAAISHARENITEGQSIAEPLRRSGEFPPLMIHMIAIGEKTGELPGMLENVAETYEEQINVRIEGMTALLEPIMIIGMGIVVGFIVISIFVPLLEISNVDVRK